MTTGQFPNWEQLYQENPVETMPWFSPDLDPDVEQALLILNLPGGALLDLGTGPGTQAIALAKLGFQVTATDLSATAVQQATARAATEGVAVSFRQDDILNSHLDRSFDLILDRGCFHVLPPNHRSTYVRTVANLLKPGRYLLLKCFSTQETRDYAPYRFTPETVQQTFADSFQVTSSELTIYQGTLNPPPQALFCILQKRA